MVIEHSPKAAMSVTARRDRPIRRSISRLRPLVDARRRSMRWSVERGNMPYSAVTQPVPRPRIQRGTSNSTVAVQITWVLPSLTRADPSAFGMKPGSIVMVRHSLLARPSNRLFTDDIPTILTTQR